MVKEEKGVKSREKENSFKSVSCSAGSIVSCRSQTHLRLNGGISVKLPLWARILLKLPIPNPHIPDFLNYHAPALMGLLCYVYLPMFLLMIYTILTVYIMMFWFSFPWNYVAFILSVAPLWLVWLKVVVKKEIRWVKSWMPFTWDIEKAVVEYVKLLEKKS